MKVSWSTFELFSWPIYIYIYIYIYMLYSHIQLYVYIYNYIRKHSQHNIRTSMNERTHFFIKIYLSHFIRKGWCFLCVRGELETETDCYILTQISSHGHSSTSSSSWLGCSTVGHWGLKPSVCRWLSIWHLVPNWLQMRLELNWLTDWLELTNSSRLWHLVI